MKDRVGLPSLPGDALRDVATEARVEEVWKRLEGELGSSLRHHARGRTDYGFLLPAAAALGIALFVSGVLVGRALTETAQAPATALAEPPVSEQVSRRPGQARIPTVAPLDQPKRQTPRVVRQPRRPKAVDADSKKVETAAPPIEVPPVPSSAAGRSEWYGLYLQGRWEEAREALELEGGLAHAMNEASPAQLMAMGDLARFNGETDVAIGAFRRVVEQFPEDQNAEAAALMLGHELKRAGDPVAAAEAFRTYQDLSTSGDFAEDALAGRIEGALEQGDLERARQLIDQYAKEFARSDRVADFRQRFERLQATSEGDLAASDGSKPSGRERSRGRTKEGKDSERVRDDDRAKGERPGSEGVDPLPPAP